MVIIIMGVSGSGKTTVGQQLATDLGWLYADADDFHSEKNIAKMSRAIPLTDRDRSAWLTRISQYLKERIQAEQNAVISCSALKKQYRKQLQLTPELIRFVYLHGSAALIKKRLESRSNHFMDAHLLASQFDTLEEPENALLIDITHSPKQISATIQKTFNLSPSEAAP